MTEAQRKENKFVGYEYTTISTTKDMETLYADSLPSFGWNFESKQAHSC